MKSTRIVYLVISSCLFLGLVLGPTSAWAQRPERPQRPEFPRQFRGMQPEAGILQLQQLAPDEETTVYVETFGMDTPQCASQVQPCRTITQGVKRARQIQRNPQAANIVLVNVQVGPGTYNEAVHIMSNWIRLRGAGQGMTTIENPGEYAVLVEFARPVFIEGFTISAPGGRALLADAKAVLSVEDCEFRDSGTGLTLWWGSTALVRSSTFVNNGSGAVGDQYAEMHLGDVVITGKSPTEGRGVLVFDQSLATIRNCEISQTEVAVWVVDSDLWHWGSIEITNNTWGLMFDMNSTFWSPRSTISNNEIGIYLANGSVAWMINASIDHNSDSGIIATGNAYVELIGSEVVHNGTGLSFDLFSHGVLRSVTLTGNGTDTETDRGSAFYVE